MQSTPEPTLELDVEFLRDRVRSPSRLSILLLLESAPKSWTSPALEERTSLPRIDVVDALTSLASDGLISECSVSGRWMYVQAFEPDTAALTRLFEAHRSGALDSYSILNDAALRRIRQSARLLMGHGLRYEQDAARVPGKTESGVRVCVRDEAADADVPPAKD